MGAATAAGLAAGPAPIAVVGATGLVGELLLDLLAEAGVPARAVMALATERREARAVAYGSEQLAVQGLQEDTLGRAAVAFMATPNEVSAHWAPWAARRGTLVIDKSSHWRMDPAVPLVVPEVNGHHLVPGVRLVSTPNCSTIPLAMVLNLVRRHRALVRVVVSTYQAVSGSGREALEEWAAQARAEWAGIPAPPPRAYPAPIAGNVLPQCDVFGEAGFTGEEWKLMRETQKVLDSPVPVVATAVRVPVAVGHSESVAIQCAGPVAASEVHTWLSDAPGIRLADDPAQGIFPTPREAAGTDDVWVGRVRSDPYAADTVHLFLSCDNLRKGAALNGLHILAEAIRRGAISA